MPKPLFAVLLIALGACTGGSSGVSPGSRANAVLAPVGRMHASVTKITAIPFKSKLLGHSNSLPVYALFSVVKTAGVNGVEQVAAYGAPATGSTPGPVSQVALQTASGDTANAYLDYAGRPVETTDSKSGVTILTTYPSSDETVVTACKNGKLVGTVDAVTKNGKTKTTVHKQSGSCPKSATGDGQAAGGSRPASVSPIYPDLIVIDVRGFGSGVFTWEIKTCNYVGKVIPIVPTMCDIYATLLPAFSAVCDHGCLTVKSPVIVCGVRGLLERSKTPDTAPACLYRTPPVPIHWTSPPPSPSPSPSSSPGPVTYRNSTPFEGTFQSGGCMWHGSGTIATTLTLDGGLSTVTGGSVAASVSASGTPVSNYSVCDPIDRSCTASLESGTIDSGELSATFETCEGASISLEGPVNASAIDAATTFAARGVDIAMGQNMLPESPPSPSPSPSASPSTVSYESVQTFSGTIANRNCRFSGHVTLTSNIVTNSTQTAVLGGSIVGDVTASATALNSYGDCSPLNITCTAEIQAASAGNGKIDADFKSCVATGVSLTGTITSGAIDATITGSTGQWAWSIGQVMPAKSTAGAIRR